MEKSSLLIISIVSVLAIGCKKNNLVHLSGKIENPKTNYLVLYIDAIKDTIHLKNNEFDTSVEISQSGFYLLKHYRIRNYIYLSRGKDLCLYIDTKNSESTLHFTGLLAPQNECLRDLKFFSSKNKLDYSDLKPDQFEKQADSIYTVKLHHFIQYSNIKPDLNKAFIDLGKTSVLYEYHSAVLEFISDNNLRTSYSKYADNITLNQKNYLEVPNYIQFLRDFISLKAAESVKNDTILLQNDSSRIKTYFGIIDSFIGNIKVKDKLYYEIANDELGYLGIKNFGDNYIIFNEKCKNETYKNEINKLYQIKALLLPDKKAPGFTCNDAENNPVSLNDFHGKYIFIDFWATWCIYCRKERPEFLKLQQQFSKKNIVFITISLDDEIQAWKNFIAKDKNNCIELFGGFGFNSSPAISYQVRGIPTFVLIDREGKIINCQAPRPSGEEIKKILSELPGI